MKKTWSMLVASLLMIALLPGLGAGTARAGDKIYWGEEQSAVYDQIHSFTLNWTGDTLDRGGLNLATMTYESKSSNADIVINQYGDIGALSIRKLLGEDLSDPTPRTTSGFSSSLKMEQGAVYLVALHDASYAKIRVDQIFPDNGFAITKVKFSYVFEEQLPAGGGSANGSAEPSIGSPAVDLLHPAEEYVFEGEGAITIPWTAAPGEYGWDIYRSDNGAPYAKVTDFVLTETEYVDHYVFVGRTYLYKLVSYDATTSCWPYRNRSRSRSSRLDRGARQEAARLPEIRRQAPQSRSASCFSSAIRPLTSMTRRISWKSLRSITTEERFSRSASSVRR